MCADGHCTWQSSSCKNVQTLYAQFQNCTLPRIIELSVPTHLHMHTRTHAHTHTHTHTHTQIMEIKSFIYIVAIGSNSDISEM